jgi:hypothetical protein
MGGFSDMMYDDGFTDPEEYMEYKINEYLNQESDYNAQSNNNSCEEDEEEDFDDDDDELEVTNNKSWDDDDWDDEDKEFLAMINEI